MEGKTVQVLSCPYCGARLAPGTTRCEYCGTWLVTRDHATNSSPADSGSPVEAARVSLPNEPTDPAAGEFGVQRTGVLMMLLSVGIVISLAGWALERPGTWWSRDEAIAVWCGAVPIWSLVVGVVWRPSRTKWLGTLASFAIGALPFMLMVMVRKGRINDDALGLGAFVGACNAAGFLLGVWGHHLVRVHHGMPKSMASSSRFRFRR